MPAKRTQRKFRNKRRKVGRKSRRVKKNRVVGGDISQIGKTYNVVDADGKQIEKEVNSFNVVPKVNGSELQNVKKYLESQSRFVMGYRKLARPGSQTDFLEIPKLNFFHKLNDNDLVSLTTKLIPTDTPTVPEKTATKEEIAQYKTAVDEIKYKNKLIYELGAIPSKYDIRNDILPKSIPNDKIDNTIIEQIKNNYEKIYSYPFDKLYFTKDIYQQ